MKKLIKVSAIYMILALCAGVFYREFTKLYHFTSKTTLSIVHAHLFLLGSVFILILALFLKDHQDIMNTQKWKRFFVLYQISLIFFVVMLMVRGVIQVLGTHLTGTIQAMISGIAGISHILLAVSLILYFFYIYKSLQCDDSDK